MWRGAVKHELVMAFAVIIAGCARGVSAPAEAPRVVSLDPCPCPDDSRFRGNKYWKSGAFDEAIETFLKCPWDNLPNLAGLAVDYPPTKKILDELRDIAWANVKPPDVNAAVSNALSLDSIVGHKGGGVRLFQLWKNEDEQARRKMNNIIWQELARNGMPREALLFEDIPQTLSENTRGFLLETIKDSDDVTISMIEDTYTDIIVSYAVALIGVGRESEVPSLLHVWQEAVDAPQGSQKHCHTVHSILDLARRTKLEISPTALNLGEAC